MNYQKKLKQYQKEVLTKDYLIVFLMEQNFFLEEYLKFIKHLYQLKNTLNILVAVLGLIRENLMESQRKILKT